MISSTYIKEQAGKFFTELKSYFNVADDLEPQQDAEVAIRSGVSFKGSQLLVLIFAILVASLGLNTDSIPVIIGAMLISPLMGPIIGMGLAIGIEDYALLRRGLKNIVMAILGSLITSAIYFLISPQYEGSSQLLARTSPSIYDVLIALFGGAAGILSIACRNKGQVMPGVAIATSLMPPLCTAGYGLATLQAKFFFGAFYLFFTNMIFILFATWIGVKLMGYKKIVYQDANRYKRVKLVVYSIVFATVGVSAYLTVQMIRKNLFVAAATAFVDKEMVFPNTQVLTHKEYVKNGKGHIDVTLIGQALPKDSLRLAMLNKLDSVGLGGTVLDIRQGFSMLPTEMTASGEKDVDRYLGALQAEIASRQVTIDSLRGALRSLTALSESSKAVMPELSVVFPSVRDLAINRLIISRNTDAPLDTVDMAFVRSAVNMSVKDREKLKEYLSVRLSCPDMRLMVNPQGFPWPEIKQKQKEAE